MSHLSQPEPVTAVLDRQHTLLEGPRIDADGAITYSDVVAGGVFRLAPGAAEPITVIERRRGVGGIVPHADGGLVVTGRDLVHVRDGKEDRPLLAREGSTGFNDLHTTRSGALLVGSLTFNPMKGESPRPGELLRVTGQGEAEVLSDEILWPNGIGTAPDESRIYISYYAAEKVLTLSAGGGEIEVFAESPRGSSDGLAVDEDGGVWIALGAGGGVARFHADGQLDEIVEVPAGFVSSLSFGGADLRDVVISTMDNEIVPETGSTLFLARSEVAGVPVAPASV